MKAAVYTKYGPPEVLNVQEVEKPTIKEDDEGIVLVKVHSASVNPFDYLHRKGYLPVRPMHGLFRPKRHVLGIDMAGTVEEVSRKVTRFKPGDQVFGECFGAHAEYVRTHEKNLSRMPTNVDFDQAAVVPTVALTALQALRDVAQVQPGDKVLIIGASGGVGHMAVQFARYFKTEITAVCSTSNLDWVKDLGAHHMIDYTKEDFTKNGEKYDLILDAVAAHTYFHCRSSLTEKGIYISEHGLKPGLQIFQILWSSTIGDKRAKMHLAQANQEDMELLAQLMEDSQLKPVIEKTYTLDQIAEAHRHVENGHTKGKVVLEVRQDN